MTAPLREWISAQGERVRVDAAVDPVSDQSSATCGAADRTIVATRAIAQGDVLVELRDGAFLNGSTWLAHQVPTILTPDEITKLQAHLAELQPSRTVLTALSLLSEKALGERSAFHGYIQQLPSAVPLPLTWSAAGKVMLQDTAAFPIMDDVLVRSVYRRFAQPLTTEFPSLWHKTGVSLDDFLWAFSIVSSRAFSVSEAREPTLLPVIDMANHAPSAPAAVIRKDDESNVYSLVALRVIDAKAPVTISYGDLSNAQLLCRYGFTLPEVMPSDTVLVSSSYIAAVFAQLTTGGTVDDALTQLDRVIADEAQEARVADANEQEEAVATADGRCDVAPVVKRRKLFAARAAPRLAFALHGDAAREFGLGDGLAGFVLANDLPMDALYDVLSVLLQHKDKRLSAVLSALDETEEARLAKALAAHERHVCRRILVGLMSLEEDSEEEEEEEDEEEDE